MAALLYCHRLFCSGKLPLSVQTGFRTGFKKSEASLANKGTSGKISTKVRNMTSSSRVERQGLLGRTHHKDRQYVSWTTRLFRDSHQSGRTLQIQSGAVMIPVRNMCVKGTQLNFRRLRKIATLLGKQSARSATLLGVTILGGTCTVSLLMKHWHGLVLHCSCEPLIILPPPPPPFTAPPPVKSSASTTGKRSTLGQAFAHLWRWLQLVLRAVRLHLTFMPFLLLYPFTLVSSRFHNLWLVALLHAVEFSGPAFVKLGQWAATRRDLFSKSFCDTFSRLHHFACVHSWESTKKILHQAYGKGWRKIFVHFGNKKNPVGSGCIAQVYHAYLPPESLPDSVEPEDFMEDDTPDEVDFAEGVEIQHLVGADMECNHGDHGGDEGEDTDDDFDVSGLIPVAVKVVHPGVRQTFQRDLTLMHSMAWAMEFLLPPLRWLALSACVAEFSGNMRKQLDLRTEARNLQRFYKNFASDPHIRVPKPLMHLNKQDVLVEMYEVATPISNFIGDSEYSPEVRKHIAELGVDALLKMVFEHNFVHGDLHPGNILVQNAEYLQNPQSSERLVLVDLCDTMVATLQDVTPPLRLIFLDCGITVRLKPEDKDKFTAVFAAVARADGEAVADLFLERSSVVQCAEPDVFRKEMAKLVTRFRQDAVSLQKVQVGELLSEVFGLVSRHKIRLESNFASIILAIGVLEGLGRSLHPDLDILERAKPILLKSAASSALTD